MQKTLFLLILLFSFTSWSREIKVITLNTNLMEEPIAITAQRKRAPLIAKALLASGADLLFLQEAFDGKARKTMAETLQKIYPYETFLKRKKLKLLNSGLVIRSKIPLKVLDTHIYDACNGIDCLSSKGIQAIQVEIEKKKVIFFQTHFQQGNKASQVQSRTYQKAELVKFMNQLSKGADAVFLVGSLFEDFHDSGFQQFLQKNKLLTPMLSGELNYTRGYPVNCFKVNSFDPKLVWVDFILEKNLDEHTHIKEMKAFKLMGDWSGQNCELTSHSAVLATLEI
ncbi:MAG: hypothetical protein ACOYL6_13775 [Bacteriovoracaceae bacterium]